MTRRRDRVYWSVRDGAVRQHRALITLRSQVQILLPLHVAHWTLNGGTRPSPCGWGFQYSSSSPRGLVGLIPTHPREMGGDRSGVAQLAEQRPVKASVKGSSPFTGALGGFTVCTRRHEASIESAHTLERANNMWIKDSNGNSFDRLDYGGGNSYSGVDLSMEPKLIFPNPWRRMP